MARDQKAPETTVSNYLIARDSDGVHLVSRRGGGDRLLWPTWKVDVKDDGETAGPMPLGSWLNHCPSDYEPYDGPFPPAVAALIARLS